MDFFTLPATTRWILVNALVVMLMMTAYRFLLATLLLAGGAAEEDLMVNGMAMDAAVAGLMGMVATILGWVPSLHPYRVRKGTRVFVWWFTLFGVLLIVLYVADLMWVKNHGQRLSGSRWLDRLIGKNAEAPSRRELPVWGLLAGGLALGILWWWLVKWLHDVLGSMGRPGKAWVRMFWQVVVFVAFLFSLLIGLFFSARIHGADLNLSASAVTALSANPVLSFFLK